jgi:hypothetical protein
MKEDKTCRRGSILRKGYIRHLKNKTIRVLSGCISAQSQSGQKRSTIDEEMMKTQSNMYKQMRRHFGTPTCEMGQIVREGYTRKSYVRKNGIRVSSAKVHPGCIKAVGLSRKRGEKGKRLFVLVRGTLTRYNYHLHQSEKERHEALNKALLELKPLSVYRKLNALYVLNKNKNPENANMYREDANWVKGTSSYMHR